MKSLKSSSELKVVILILTWLMLVHFSIVWFPDSFRSVAQAQVFEWPFLALWAVMAIAGAWLEKRNGWPRQPGTALATKLIQAVSSGLVLGLLAMVNDRIFHWTDFVAQRMNIPSIHIPFPAAYWLYPAGAAVHEIFNRLFLISVLVWLLMRFIRTPQPDGLVWGVIALTSLIEPWGDLGLVSLGAPVMILCFLLDFGLNVVQGWLFWRYGFIYAWLCRVAFYGIWHILYSGIG